MSTQYPYVEYQRKKYGNVPLWVLVNALEFGTLSKMYEFFQMPLQITISKNFNFISNAELKKYLKFLVSFRNVCAHHERCFAYRSYCSIPDTALHRKLSIKQQQGAYVYGKNDAFAVLITFKFMLPHDDFIKMKRTLTRIFDKFFDKCNIISQNALYNYMGFPLNWKAISKYRKLK